MDVEVPETAKAEVDNLRTVLKVSQKEGAEEGVVSIEDFNLALEMAGIDVSVMAGLVKRHTVTDSDGARDSVNYIALLDEGGLTRRQPEEGTPVRLRTKTVRNFEQSEDGQTATVPGGALGDDTVMETQLFRWDHAAAQLGLHLFWPLSLPVAERWLGVKPCNQWLTCRSPERPPNTPWSVVARQALMLNLGNIMTINLYVVIILWAALGDHVDLLTSSEILLASMVHVLRIIMLAVKYGFMPLAEYQVVTQSDDSTEVVPLMIDELLVNWMNPSDAVVVKEIERAATERGFQQDEAIHFDTAKLHFADAVGSHRLMKMLKSTCTCHSAANHTGGGPNAETVTHRVADVCFDIYRKSANDTATGWHSSAAVVCSGIVAVLPFFWRADHYGWSNTCGRLEHPIEIVLIIACAFNIFLFTQTNLRFMLVCLYDFQRRFLSLQLCTELIKPTFSLQVASSGHIATTPNGDGTISRTSAAPSAVIERHDDGINAASGDPERQQLQENTPPETSGPRCSMVTIRHPPVLDLVDLGTANATGWFVLYDVLTLMGKRFQYRCQVLATGNILLLLAGGLKMLADVWADNSLELWVDSDASVSLLPVTFFAYSFANVCIVVRCIVLGHQTNRQWSFARVEIRAAQRELAMIEDGCPTTYFARRRQAHDTLQLLSMIAKEMKELNLVRPVQILGVRADMKLLATVGTAVGTVVGVVSQRLASQELSGNGSL